MAVKFVACVCIFRLIAFDAQRSEQVCTGIAGKVFQVAAQG